MCRVCNWNREFWTRADPRFLELHHLKPHVEKGENIAENLIVVCSRCHDDIHAGRINVTN
jgi:predicted HNH restriction endonuclease